MAFKHLIVLLLFLSLMSCGGGGSSDTPKDPPANPPVVTLSIDSASVDESSTVVINYSAKDYQGTTITSELSCDIGTLDGNNYTAPSVAIETTATCTATATDSGNRSSTETLSLTIYTVTPVLALAHGETSATTAKLTTIDVSFADVSEGLIDATLNGEAINLGVTSDHQLVYFPSLYANGAQTLIIELEGESVTYEYNAKPSIDIISDTSAYVTNYITQMRSEVDEQIVIAQSKGISSTEIQKLNDIKNSFDVTLLSELTIDEIDLLAYLIYQNISELYADENAVNSSAYYSKSNSSFIAAKDLTACERSAIRVVLAGGVAYTTTLAVLGLAGTGIGIPAASVVILGTAVSWNVLNNSLDRMGEWCFEWAQTDLDNINSAETQTLTGKNKSHKLSTPIKTTKSINEIVGFFHNEERTFVATRKYQILTGAENHVTSIIDSVNKVRGAVIKLVNLIGESNTPVFILDYVENPVDVNDYLYEQIDPSFLTMSSISSTYVKGYMLVDGNSFDLNFDIQDLEIGHVAFQFSLTDSTINNGTTVIDAEVTLNPPIAYSETFSVVIGEDMTARLQADFETGFEIKNQPQKGTIELGTAFSYPGGGLFTYTPDETITEDTTDSFTFVATNGSTENGGKSNEAIVTLEISAAKYQVQLAASYSSDGSDIVYQTISSGDEVTLPNGVRLYAGLTLNGQLVGVNSAYDFWPYSMPLKELTTEDVIMDYNFNLKDFQNNKVIVIPVKLTLSNEAFRNIISRDLIITGSSNSYYSNGNQGSIVFREDLTYTADGPFGVKNGTWRATGYSHIPSTLDPCSDNNTPNPGIKGIGSFAINGASTSFAAASILHVREGGTFTTGICQSAEYTGYLAWYE
jgi:hypothetical protein